MSRNMRPHGRGKCLSKQNEAILRSLALLNPDLAVFQVNVRNFNVAKFTNSHRRIKKQPQHQRMLNVICLIYNFIKSPKVIGI